MATETRWVCLTCKANWWAAPGGFCPGCKSPHVEEQDVEVKPDGTVVVK